MTIIHLTPEDTTKELIAEGNLLFKEKPEYRLSVNAVDQLPIGNKKEFAFANMQKNKGYTIINI